MIYSPYASSSQEIFGKVTAPADVPYLTMTAQGDQALLSWTKITDLDVVHGGTYWVRYTSSIDPLFSNWESSSNVTKEIPGSASSYSVPLMEGTYLIKALDSSGNESLLPASVVSNVADILELNAVYTSTQHPLFGSNTSDKGVNDTDSSNVFYDIVDDAIEIDSVVLESGTNSGSGSTLTDSSATFDATMVNKVIRNTTTGVLGSVVSVTNATNLVLSSSTLLANGNTYRIEGDVKSEGYYYFTDQAHDLGAVYTSRIITKYAVQSFSPTALFDFKAGLFDDASGLFDGESISDTNVAFEISTTEDLPSNPYATWGPWTAFFVGDYLARGVRFRMKLTTGSSTNNIKITDLSVTVDMPDTIKSASNVQSDSGTNNGTSVVTYATAFTTAPTVGVTMFGQSGDYYTISATSASGFTINFLNSSNTAIQKTFNWISTGY